MIGIYKITNKLNGKSYIGQSIHCDKRFKEHCRGKKQFIDETIQLEGIENFSFELLEECEEAKLNEREDYYINKYNTMFPNGYNKRWNISQKQTDKNYELNPYYTKQELEKILQKNEKLLKVFLILQNLYNIFPEQKFTKRCIINILGYDDKDACYYHELTKSFALLEYYQLIKLDIHKTKEGYTIFYIKNLYQLF